MLPLVLGAALIAQSTDAASVASMGSFADSVDMPAEILVRAEPAYSSCTDYPEGTPGTTILEVDIDDSGDVQGVAILISCGHRELDLSAVQAAWSTQWLPALSRGEAIGSTRLMRYQHSRLLEDEGHLESIAGASADSLAAQAVSTDDLAIASQTLYGYLEADSALSWGGSAFVVREAGDTLVLVTNRHCLGIDDIDHLGCAPGPQRVYDYGLSLEFASGYYTMPFAVACSRHYDLALLYVHRRSMQSGVDYVVLRPDTSVEFAETDEVWVVGSGARLRNSVSRGIISAFRDFRVFKGVDTPYIQTDAATNPGNSGGPLLLDNQGNLHLIGVNQAKRCLDDSTYAEGISMAINLSELCRRHNYFRDRFHENFVIYSNTAAGAEAAFRQL